MIMMRSEKKWFADDYLIDIEKYFTGEPMRKQFDDGIIYNCFSFAHGLCLEQRAISGDGRDSIIKQINLHQGDEHWLLQAETLLYKWFIA